MILSFMDLHPWLYILLWLGTPILLPGIWFTVEMILFSRGKKRLKEVGGDTPALAAACSRHKMFAIISGCLTGLAVVVIIALIVLFMIAIAFM